MNKTLSKPIVSRHSITKGQASLYELTETKIANNQAITLNEAIKIYSSVVCRNFVGGKPAGYVWRYDHGTDRYTTELEALGEYELNQRAIQWLMQAIGSLVMKGYLKVTPMITLGD